MRNAPSTGVVTPERAVARAFWMVNGPVFLVMFGSPAGLLAIGYALGSDTQVGAAFCLLSIPAFVICWPLAWMTWSILTPRWRFWAYQNVADIDELKRLAVAGRIIWPEGHIFQRTEIMSPAQNHRLQEIEASKRLAMQSRPETSES